MRIPRPALKFYALVSVFLFTFSGLLLAEDIGVEAQRLSQETHGVKQIAKTAAKSKEEANAAQYKTGVTYEDILKDPDNIALNVRYAKEQIARGNLVGAAATLERILLVNPNLADVRFLYAVVLYRLDSLNEAQKELDLLKTLPLPPEILAQIKDYEKKIKYRKRQTHFGLTQSNGWGYDTNRNASPHSKEQLFYDFPVAVQGSNERRPDTHFINATTVDVVHDLGFQAGHTVFGSFTYLLQEQNRVHSLNIGSFQYELGGTYKGQYFNFTPSYFYNYLFLSDQSFLRSQGGNFLFDRDLTKKLNAYYDFRVERQDFMNISENTDSYNRRGPEFDHTWGVNYMLTPTMRWNSNIGYGEKYAKQDYYAYDRISLNNTHTWIWPKGQFLINTFNTYFDHYETPEFSVSSMHRRDDTIRYRVTYGAPLETLLVGKILPPFLRSIIFTISYEYYHTLSSITNYTFSNNKIEGLLTKRVEF